MATSTDVYGYGTKVIHIPLCDRQPCRVRLLELVEKLRDVDIHCEYKYSPLGLYVDSFQKFVRTYPCTILHVCPMFFKKLTQALDVTSLLKEFHHKLMCVRFFHPVDSTGHSEEDVKCETYFGFFSQHYATNESSIAEFVDVVKSAVEPHINRQPQTCESSSNHTEQAQENVDVNRTDNCPLSDDINNNQALETPDQPPFPGMSTTRVRFAMERVPDMFGQTHGQEVFIRADRMQAQHGELDSDHQEGLCCCIDAATNHTHTHTLQANVFSVLKQTIPELYNSKRALALAHIAVSGQSLLQTHTVLLLELMLLEGHASKNRDHLVSIEEMLKEHLDKQGNKFTTDQQESSLLRQRMSNLLLMLRYEIALHCQEMKQNKKYDRNTRIRKTFRAKGSPQNASSNIEVYQKTAQQLQEVVNDFCKLNMDKDPYPLANRLLDRSNASQMAVVIEHLKAIFSTMNAQSLFHLKQYVKCKKIPPPECVSMIVLGLTLFLCHGLRNASDRNIQEISTAVVEVLETASQRDVQHEVNWMQVMLIFDKTPVIRQEIIRYFRMKHLYPSEMEFLLLTEIKRLLHPFLIVNTRKHAETYRGNWQTTRGTFGGTPVIVLFHMPAEKDHELKNETQFINFVDTMHTNQVKKLRTLQHELVISMFAYQETSIPQFYVLEDYTANNLQTDPAQNGYEDMLCDVKLALKNRNDNRRYFDDLTLMRFSTCAIEALEYCHSMNIVHRNLTADSLFIVAEYRVKLGGFTLAIDMTTHTELTVVSGSSQIPTRWSAPESLSRLKYSKASDVYMFGPLLYEIHTHGALPYSHENLQNNAFVDKVTSNEIRLCKEMCFKKEVYDEICRCAAFHPKDRPNAGTVKETMVNLCKYARREHKSRFPILSEQPEGHERQPSTTFAKGSPEYELQAEQLYVRPLLNVGVVEGLIQYQMGDGYLFRENVKRKMSQYMLDHLNGSSSDVIPECMNMQRDGEENLTIEYYIPSLSVRNILHFESSLDVYLTAVLQVAERLENLHRAWFILGDLSTSSVFVEQDSGTEKVHIVSWAHLKLNYTQMFSDRCDQLRFSMGSKALARAAPEVVERGEYSPASDVFCFGQLLKDVCRRLNIDFSTYVNMSVEKGKPERWDQCYKELKEIASQCMEPIRNKRLPLVNVMERIKNIIAQARPSSAGQQDSTSGLHIPNNSISNSAQNHTRSADSGRMSRLHSISSETTMKKRFSSDSDDDIIPKFVYEKYHSADSGILSYSEAIALPKYGQYSMLDSTEIYSLGNSSVSDMYMDAISSPAPVNMPYNNMPRPQKILDDPYAGYSEPDEFPPGYKHAQLLARKHSAHQENLVEVSNYLSDEPVYIDIESLPLQIQEPRNGRALHNSEGNKTASPAHNLIEVSNYVPDEPVYLDIESLPLQMQEPGNVSRALYNSEGNNATSPAHNGQLPASTGTEPPNENILTAFTDLPDSFGGYQRLRDIALLNGRLDSSHVYQPLRLKSSDEDCEVFV